MPLQPGARLRVVKTKPREYDLPLYIEDTSTVALAQRIAALARALDPGRGDVRIRKTSVTGTVRELTCRYRGGLDGDDGAEGYGTAWREFVLTFRAFDPYWYAPAPVGVTYQLASSPALFFPILPLRVTSSSVFVDATIDNIGSVPTWPVWQVTGPGEGLILDNLSTGERLSLTATLSSGEGVTIDTRPGIKSVVSYAGANLFGGLSADSSLWALASGPNTVRIELAAATEASAVRLSYTPRDLAAP